jgi:hypothetical protein
MLEQLQRHLEQLQLHHIANPQQQLHIQSAGEAMAIQEAL